VVNEAFLLSGLLIKNFRKGAVVNLQEHPCIQEERLRKLEIGQAETVVYYKNIRDDIQEIKITMKDIQQSKPDKTNDAKLWQPVVIEALKLVGTALALFVAIKLAG
jgi:hypothetical protein